MGSGALVIVNDILLLTGDHSALPTISGSIGSIGERVVGFMNLTVSDIERKANWPELRVNSQGTADGINDILEFTGTDDVRADSAVSCWIAGLTLLSEVTPEQFDIIIASQQMSGPSQIFQRGTSSSGKLTVQIYPMPAKGNIVNVSAYKRADRFDVTDDNSTTELDDDIIRYGALMHMDAYDDSDRGYAALFENALNGSIAKLYSNSNFRVMVESYA